MFDQPYRLVTRMSACDNIYRVVQKRVSARGDEIHRLTASEMRILTPLVRDGLIE